MEPMVPSERARRPLTALASTIERLFSEGPGWLSGAAAEPDLVGHLATALHGGFPTLITASDQGRRRWLQGYTEHLVTRDAELAGASRDPVRLRRYLRVVAASTAQTVPHARLQEAAGIDRKTAVAYDDLLEALHVIVTVPAWSGSRLKRLAKAGKRHLADPALLMPLLGVDVAGALRDAALLGAALETLANLQLRALAAVSESAPTLYHLKAEGHEVDLLIEHPDGRLIAIEVKATAAPRPLDARQLLWLHEQLGDRVAASLLLHTGRRAFTLAPNVMAVPIGALG